MGRFTQDDLINALERNGLKQVKGMFIEYDEGRAVGACAVGQIAVNLSIPPERAGSELDLLFDKHERINEYRHVKCPSKSCTRLHHNTSTMVYHLNDEHGWKFSSIAKWLRKS